MAKCTCWTDLERPFLASRSAIVRSASSPLAKARCSLVITMSEHISKKWQDLIFHEMDGVTVTKYRYMTYIYMFKYLILIFIKYWHGVLGFCSIFGPYFCDSSHAAMPLQLAKPSMCRHSFREFGTTATLQSSLSPVAISEPTKECGMRWWEFYGKNMKKCTRFKYVPKQSKKWYICCAKYLNNQWCIT